TMVSGGYLVLSAEDKTYFPSLRLVRVGRWMAECYPAEARLSALVEDLHGRTGDIVTVTIETDCFMQVMAWAQAGAPDPHLSHGYRVPVIGSAIGGAALTTKSKDEIRKIA